MSIRLFVASVLFASSMVQVAAHQGDSEYVFLPVKSGISRSFFASSAAGAVFPILYPQPEGSSVAFYCNEDREQVVISFGIELLVSHGILYVFDKDSGRKLEFSAPFVAAFEEDMMVVTVDTADSIAPLLRDLRDGGTYTFQLTQVPTNELAEIEVSFPEGRVTDYDLGMMHRACSIHWKYR